MTQFHAGQEVEVTDSRYPLSTFSWRKAKIVCPIDPCEVKFPDGTRAVFDAEHIRAVQSRAEIAQDFLKHAPLRNGERKILERIAKGLP